MVRENIKLLSELGQGSHGIVYEGTARNIKDKADIVSVAVKTSNSPPNTSCASRRSCVVCICDETEVTGIVFMSSAITVLFFMSLKISVYVFVSSKISIQYYNLIALKI